MLRDISKLARIQQLNLRLAAGVTLRVLLSRAIDVRWEVAGVAALRIQRRRIEIQTAVREGGDDGAIDALLEVVDLVAADVEVVCRAGLEEVEDGGREDGGDRLPLLDACRCG